MATPIRSRIDAVTVYRRGARVTRVAEVQRHSEGFPQSVRVTGLPLGLEDSSVKARVVGDNAPVAADLRVTLEVPELDQELPPGDDVDVEQARRAEARADAVVRQLEQERGRLANLELLDRPAGAEGEPPKASPTEARLAMLQLRSDRERSIRKQIRAAKEALRDATRAREEAEEADRRASTARQARAHELRKSVVVSLRGGDAASARVELEYFVPGARWAPSYTVRFDSQMKSAELALRAVVGQRTGEDWGAVALTLSTASASQWAELPELHSLRVGKAQRPPPKAGWRPPPTGVDELYRDYDRVFAERFPQHDADLGIAVSAPAEAAAAVEPEPEYAYAEELDYDANEAFADDVRFSLRTPPAPQAAPAPMAGAAAPSGFAEMERRARAQIDERKMMRSEEPMMPTQAVSKSAGVFGAIGNMVTRTGTLVMGGAGDSMAMNAPLPPELLDDVTVSAPTDLLAYGDLRMASARSPRRGRLDRADRREQYLSLLVEQRISVSFDVISVIRAAVRDASAMEREQLPHGHIGDWNDQHDYAYVAADRVDVPSDGDFHSLPLASSAADVSLLYVCVPRESAEVFRTAEVTNPLGSPLLAGPADVYIGDEFFLTSSIDFTAARGAIDLGLGVEQGIKVARNSKFREETTGLLGGGLELEHQLMVDIKNNLDRDAAIEVRERIPVTREGEEDIEVKIGSVSPPWQSWDPFPDRAAADKLRGGHRWRVDVAAGSESNLRAKYTVKMSSKLELVGGNRRED